MNLADLLAGYAGHADMSAAGDIVVRGLSLDSRDIRAGDAFVALKGAKHHGITFAPTALARGAAAILAEKPETAALAPASVATGIGNGESRIGEDAHAPLIWIDGLRDKVGAIAARFFGDPSQALTVIGVTGTNGKTSTVHLLAQALHHAGHRVATIGTLGAGMFGDVAEGARTTPDAIAVQGLLATFRDEGASHVAMEVSSHALDQGRVNAVAFDFAVFTNLTRDHLDYHGTMHSYGAAKERLFAWSGLRTAIINVDDAFGRALAARVPGDVELLRYGVEREDADLIASAIETGTSGLQFHLATPWGEGNVATRLLGRFNVSNLLAVAACLGKVGFSFDKIRDALAALLPVTGRMNRIGGERELPLVVVDYAHTPDALEQALTSLRAHAHGHLICVFGCGGERDAGKRPEMGAIAEALADRIIITDDNPRGEDGDAIVAQIVAGLKEPADATIQRDRGAAIALAIREAQPGDIVLIAGKGHEPYQEVAGVRHAFDDLAVARAVLEARA
jgi:UDP-N-acetylmuramoyl-L-alanyl-D-glutamate--2,6-diaminopimelate ligase